MKSVPWTRPLKNNNLIKTIVERHKEYKFDDDFEIIDSVDEFEDYIIVEKSNEESQDNVELIEKYENLTQLEFLVFKIYYLFQFYNFKNHNKNSFKNKFYFSIKSNY